MTGNTGLYDLTCKYGIPETNITSNLVNTIIEMNYKTDANKERKREELHKSLVKANTCEYEQMKMYKKLFGQECIISAQKESKMINGVRGDKQRIYKIRKSYFDNFENIFFN